MAYVAESGHWYDRKGNPAYEVPNKSKGGMRPTRITDAKKMDLVPSVTAILKILDKPALTNWKVEQAIKAAIHHPFKEGSEDEYIKFIKDKSMEEATQARDTGSEIHGAIEEWFRGNMDHKLVIQYLPWCQKVDGILIDEFGDCMEWKAERSFSSDLGYGGKCDLHGYDADGNLIVLDFKTKDFSKGKPKAYDEQGMQLIAYAVGFDSLVEPRLFNVFIDRDTPEATMIEWDESQHDRLFAMFTHSLNLWKAFKKFDPSY